MFIQPFLFFELTIAVAVLAISLSIIAFFYAKLLKTFHSLERKKEELEHISPSKAEQILQRAKQKAHNIVEEAVILEKGEKEQFTKDVEAVVDAQKREIEDTSQQMKKLYEEMMQDIKNETIKTFQNVSKEIERESVEELSDFKQMLEKETVSAQKIIGEKLEKEYEGVRQEIGEYKAKELQKAQESIYALIRSVTEEVIGKALSPQDHEQLILQALEKAKSN